MKKAYRLYMTPIPTLVCGAIYIITAPLRVSPVLNAYDVDFPPAVESETSQQEIIQMDFSVEQGTLYSMDTVTQWEVQLNEFLQHDNLSQEDITQINQELNMCYGIETLLNYYATSNETIPQMIAKVISQEIGGLTDELSYSTAAMERAAVAWCILNRVDQTCSFASWESTAEQIISVTKQPNQFAYYNYRTIMNGTEEIATDVLIRWILEKYDYGFGRVLPSEFTYFGGNGTHNTYRNTYSFNNTVYWDWSASDPYNTVD